MRFLVQRVTRASVSVNGNLESETAAGLLVFIGISATDGVPDADYLADKLVNLRVFPDSEGRMNLSALVINGSASAGFTIYSLRRLPQGTQAEL